MILNLLTLPPQTNLLQLVELQTLSRPATQKNMYAVRATNRDVHAGKTLLDFRAIVKGPNWG
jgi:hypothetical protein